MKLEHIKEILKTVSFYNTVNITQTFSKEDTDRITVTSVKNTGVLQMTFIESGKVIFFESIDQAAEAVEGNINSPTLI
ncbi:hypothetical protein [Planomicrobium sp. CPCC 101079]|uniref:hypothetical protein n=1 Tax=Planomicrobium sp. CPCC 101079 TaxID=2599618 RepID=UPI0011B4F478|nr:hypothetical protein [Planomicrobium sp. CPCC 101079]TWT01136.1 hypothetical protein FQV28_17280 [Planomicrobium sp. CPCC 101079]